VKLFTFFIVLFYPRVLVFVTARDMNGMLMSLVILSRMMMLSECGSDPKPTITLGRNYNLARVYHID
jgi:hypothetical protein